MRCFALGIWVAGYVYYMASIWVGWPSGWSPIVLASSLLLLWFAILFADSGPLIVSGKKGRRA